MSGAGRRLLQDVSIEMVPERLRKHGGFHVAEVAAPRELSAAILDRVQRFGVPPLLVQRG